MQKTYAPIRHFPPAARLATEPGSRIKAGSSWLLTRSFTALVRPSARTAALANRVPSCHSPFQYLAERPWRRTPHGRWGPATQLPGWKAVGRLGQVQTQYKTAFTGRLATTTLGQDVRETLAAAEAEAELQPDPVGYWERFLLILRRGHGDDGVWAGFETIQDKGHLSLFARFEADTLRDEVLTAALRDDWRISVLVNAAQQLYMDTGFRWPGMYTKVMHFCLNHARHKEAVRWHLQLSPNFTPGGETFGAMVSSFIVDPSPQMQSSLTTIYVLGTQRRLYDYIIPALFASGQSKLARTWRRKLTLFEDLPATAKSRPFLRFLASYYPSIPLTSEEIRVAGLEDQSYGGGDPDPPESPAIVHDLSMGQYSDSMVAKWFASSWTSVEFAINLVHKLGLRIIGPRSLQALALREPDATDVASRITQLEKLGIEAAPQTYCKALIFFAKHGADALLANLVNCDIHPDEFDDLETRQMLMAAAVREGDCRRADLLQGIERATETGLFSRRLNSLLCSELAKHQMGKTKLVLDRMEALRLSVSQDSTTLLLERAFYGLGKHPVKRAHTASETKQESLLDRAIDLIRRIACHDVAIPLRYWKLLLYNLGRRGRLDELEQLCLEVTQLYTPLYGGLVPVHREDLPRLIRTAAHGDEEPRLTDSDVKVSSDAVATQSMGGMESVHKTNSDKSPKKIQIDHLGTVDGEALTDSVNAHSLPTGNHTRPLSNSGSGAKRDMQRRERLVMVGASDPDAKAYIPADLPFTHREHPVQKVFDAHLQRSIVRWGFDQTLAARPCAAALMEMDYSGIRRFDVACGVRLLALLRDRGVLIDTQRLRAAVLSRIAIGRVPGRLRDRSRDKNELSTENMKKIVDEAWGSEILPSLPEMRGELERQKPKLWSRYPTLFGKAFDHGREATSTE